MAKARIGLYSVKGDTLTRTHKPCPKCGPGTFLAEHANRRSCGHCGYSETKTVSPSAPKPVIAAKGAPTAKATKPAAAAKPPAAPPGAKPPAAAPAAKPPKPA